MLPLFDNNLTSCAETLIGRTVPAARQLEPSNQNSATPQAMATHTGTAPRMLKSPVLLHRSWVPTYTTT